MNTPNCKKPCSDCPFRKDSLKGWLGESRAKEIVESDTFVCHKTSMNGKKKDRKQCAGFMLLKKDESMFYALARSLGMNLNLQGKDLIFDSDSDFIKHHTN